jgi:ABC-type multidrug transport system fused ATPase/permease subunit
LSVFLKLSWYFRRQWRRYLIALTTLLVVALLVMIPPRVAGHIIDAAANQTLTRNDLLQAVMLLGGVAVLVYILRYVWRASLYGASYQLAALLRERIYNHLCLMPPQFFSRHKTGDLMARATNDVTAVEMTAGEGVLSMVDGVMTGVIVLAMLTFTLSWKLTLLALLPWPVMSYFMWRYGTALHHSFGRAQEEFGRVNDCVQQALTGIRLIKALGGEAREIAIFRRAIERASDANIAVAKTDAKYDPTIFITVGTSFLFTVAGGAWFVHQDEMTVGELTSFTMYLGYLIWPMFAFGWLLNLVERGRAAYTRIEELLNTASPIPDTGTVTDVASTKVDFAIQRFAYPTTAVDALSGIEISVPAGTTLGIVGHTGSGKSTLLRLLLRQFESPEAHVKLGDRPVADYTLHTLHAHLGVVPQDPFLFSTTIGQNIALGRPEATLEQIRRAAQRACIAKDIEAFPAGYDTLVGDRGVTLSGGQKQRVAIARALLLDPDVLLLDDALSAVDVETESSIIEYLRQHRRNKTTLIVCHRLSAVMHAEHIVVLEHGAVVEQGGHRELLARGAWYAQTFRYQQIERAVSEGR